MEAKGDLRDGLRDAANIVARDAASRVPRASGRAAKSIRGQAGGNKAYVVGGKKAVPYYGWLDFGSRRAVSGRPRSVGPWRGTGSGPSEGRFIYPAAEAMRGMVVNAIARSVDAAIRKAGF